MVMVRFDPLCVACKVSMYASIVLCTGSSLGWGAECSWSIIMRCCSLSVSCVSSVVGVDWGVVDFKLANWFCQNCSNNSAKGWQVSVSLQYLSDSWSPLGIMCFGGARSRELSLFWQECHDFHILLSRSMSCDISQRCLAEPSGVIFCGLGTCACCSGSTGLQGKSHLPGDGCDDHVRLVIFCAAEGLCKVV